MKISTTRNTSSSGFSLAELMVVIVIIGLLSALVIPNIMQKHFKAQVAAAKTQISTLTGALNEFAINNTNQYPDSLDILVVLDENGYSYLSTRTLPNDPWGNPYVYEPPTPGESRPRVICYGNDGAPGGAAKGRDFDSWPDND